LKEKFTRPQIKEFVHFFPLNKNEYQIRIGEDDFVYKLKGESADYLTKILPYLNGKYTIKEIISKTRLNRKIVCLILDKLKDFLIDADTVNKRKYKKFRDQIKFFSLWSKKPMVMQKMITDSITCVVNYGNLALEMIESLYASGFQKILVCDDSRALKENRFLSATKIYKKDSKQRIYLNDKKICEKITLIVVCLDAFDPSFCEEVNEFAVTTEKPCLFLRKNGVASGIVGPLVVPFLTACFKCLDLRIKANLDFYDEYIAYENYLRKKRVNKDTPCLKSLDKVLANLAIMEIIKYITGFESPTTFSRYLIVNQIDFSFETHDVLKLPRCPVCGIKEDSFRLPWLEPIAEVYSDKND